MVSFLLWPTFNTKFKKKSNCFIEPRRGNFHRLNIDKQESQKVNFRWIQLTFLEEIEMRTAKQSFWIQPKIVTKSTEFFSWWNWAWSHCIWLADVMHHSFSFRATSGSFFILQMDFLWISKQVNLHIGQKQSLQPYLLLWMQFVLWNITDMQCNEILGMVMVWSWLGTDWSWRFWGFVFHMP